MPTTDEIKQALAEQRKRLKIELLGDRALTVLLDGGPRRYKELRPRCDYCGDFIKSPDLTVMHEWLIRRGRLPIATQYKIMHEYNCSLLHVDCHAQYETTRKCKLRCARAQYKRYGRDEIAAWVQGLGLRQHVEIPTEEEANAILLESSE